MSGCKNLTGFFLGIPLPSAFFVYVYKSVPGVGIVRNVGII